MTKLIIWLGIIAVVAALGWGGYTYWEKVENDKEVKTQPFNPNQLAGLPWQLETSLQQAESQGADALGQWLKTYGRSVADPRKAWVELDYCVMIAKKNPLEARRIFADVKQRTPPNSPVMPRIKELQKSYE
jgi:hypothetical protein